MSQQRFMFNQAQFLCVPCCSRVRDAGLRLLSISFLDPLSKTMMKLAIATLLAGSAAAFAPSPMAKTSSSVTLQAEKSASLPFLNRPALVSCLCRCRIILLLFLWGEIIRHSEFLFFSLSHTLSLSLKQ